MMVGNGWEAVFQKFWLFPKYWMGFDLEIKQILLLASQLQAVVSSYVEGTYLTESRW